MSIANAASSLDDNPLTLMSIARPFVWYDPETPPTFLLCTLQRQHECTSMGSPIRSLSSCMAFTSTGAAKNVLPQHFDPLQASSSSVKFFDIDVTRFSFVVSAVSKYSTVYHKRTGLVYPKVRK